MYKKNVHRRKQNLEKGINLVLCLVLVLGIIPVFITTLMGRLKVEDLLGGNPEKLVMEEVLVPEILAKQIGINMPKEAIKAQSVIARTQYMAALEKGENVSSAFSTVELQELWGEQFDTYYKQLQTAIEETAGETLQYNNEYIYAAYHQSSAGNTRDMKEYYEKSSMPYLGSVDCHEDSTAEGYLNVFFWEKEEFGNFMKDVFAEENVKSGSDVQIIKRDESGYALEVQVGQTVYEGEEFRKKMSLPSACFEITLIEEDVRIVTMGQGHGFGLSQHMAAELAEDGMDYQEILKYFYQGVTITK